MILLDICYYIGKYDVFAQPGLQCASNSLSKLGESIQKELNCCIVEKTGSQFLYVKTILFEL